MTPTPAQQKSRKMERRVAKAMGGTRVYGSGGFPADTKADVRHLVYFVECKNRANFTHHSEFLKIIQKARAEDKTPILVTHTNDRKGDLVVLRLEDFVELITKIICWEGCKYNNNDDHQCELDEIDLSTFGEEIYTGDDEYYITGLRCKMREVE